MSTIGNRKSEVKTGPCRLKPVLNLLQQSIFCFRAKAESQLPVSEFSAAFKRMVLLCVEASRMFGIVSRKVTLQQLHQF